MTGSMLVTIVMLEQKTKSSFSYKVAFFVLFSYAGTTP